MLVGNLLVKVDNNACVRRTRPISDLFHLSILPRTHSVKFSARRGPDPVLSRSGLYDKKDKIREIYVTMIRFLIISRTIHIDLF